ncbi:hypothetical protein [Jannaschia sp. R86511]|uniref:hypothetical protein n=1 Tax=Jannaschia sp. R86511 TaxID=3093853 RepID=UPI0036D2BB89
MDGLTALLVRAGGSGDGGMENPLDGVTPTFAWGTAGDRVMTVFAVFWGMLIVLAIAFLATSLVKMAHSRGSHAGQYADAREKVVWSGIGLGGLIGLPIIVAFLIWLFG